MHAVIQRRWLLYVTVLSRCSGPYRDRVGHCDWFGMLQAVGTLTPEAAAYLGWEWFACFQPGL